MSKMVYVFHNREQPFNMHESISSLYKTRLFDCWKDLENELLTSPPDALILGANIEIHGEFLKDFGNFLILQFSEKDDAVARLLAAKRNAHGVVTTVPAIISKIKEFKPQTKKLPHAASMMVVSNNLERACSISTYFRQIGSEITIVNNVTAAMEEFIASQEEYSSQYHVSKNYTKRINKYSLYDAIIVDKKLDGEFTSFDFLNAVRQTALSPHVPLILLADSVSPDERNAAMALNVTILPRYVNNDNLKFAIICAIEKHTTSFNDYNFHYKTVKI